MPKGVYQRQPKKLSEEAVHYIRQFAGRRCLSALARKFGVSRQRIHQIKMLTVENIDNGTVAQF